MHRIFRLVLIVLFSFPLIAHASVSITEIMYDLDGSDANREWIEVCNYSTENVSFSGWKFNDGSNHTINEPSVNGGIGSAILSSGGCLILAADASLFISEYPEFSGTVLDTVMSLNNSGEELTLLNQGGDIQATVLYESSNGAAGDGKSLHRNGAEFIAGPPTPGTENEEILDEENSPSSPSQGGEQLGDEEKEKKVSVPQIVLELTLPRYVTAGVPVPITGRVLGYSGEDRTYGFFTYNFGDGSVRTTTVATQPSYTYKYPGEYVVTFSYALSEYSLKPEGEVERIVTVISPTVAIADFLSDGALVLKNTANQDIDLAGFSISSGSSTTVLPHTLLKKGKNITIPPTVTQFSSATEHVTLTDPSGKLLQEFPERAPVVVKTSRVVSAQKLPVKPLMSAPAISKPTESTLTALATASTAQKHPTLLTLIAAFGIGLLGASSFWYLRASGANHAFKEDEASLYSIEEVGEEEESTR
jgi:hypothetical protein